MLSLCLIHLQWPILFFFFLTLKSLWSHSHHSWLLVHSGALSISQTEECIFRFVKLLWCCDICPQNQLLPNTLKKSYSDYKFQIKHNILRSCSDIHTPTKILVLCFPRGQMRLMLDLQFQLNFCAHGLVPLRILHKV